MSKLVFGRDRVADAWPATTTPFCRPDSHLVGADTTACTICGWVDEQNRCQVVGCTWLGEYEVEVGPQGEGPDFTTVIRSGLFCVSHAFLGGMALVPTDERPS